MKDKNSTEKAIQVIGIASTLVMLVIYFSSMSFGVSQNRKDIDSKADRQEVILLVEAIYKDQKTTNILINELKIQTKSFISDQNILNKQQQEYNHNILIILDRNSIALEKIEESQTQTNNTNVDIRKGLFEYIDYYKNKNAHK